MIEHCCAFTGHRPKKFPWGYNEADIRCLTIKKELASQIAKLIDNGCTDFFSGMAEGTDIWAALSLQSQKSALPVVRG